MTPDLIVVGAGSAGCVVAGELARDRSVVLVEAGPVRPPAEIGAPLDDEHDWGSVALMPGGRSVPYRRGRGLGGGSAVNATVALRPPPSDLDWSSRWTPEHLNACLDDVSARLGLVTWPVSDLPTLQQSFIRAAPGARPLPMNRVGGKRRTAFDAFVAPLSEDPALRVQQGATVDRLMIAAGRVTGVELSTGEVLRGGEVVVCAGAIGTPRLLRRSGVEHPMLGENLSDHVAGTLLVDVLPGALDGARAGIQSVLADDHLQIFPVARPDPDGAGQVSLYAALQAVHRRGRVTAHAVEQPFLDDPDDLARLHAGIEQAREIAARMDDVIVQPIPTMSADDLYRTHIPFNHAVGTCALGSVVDEGCRIDGLVGLRIVDASIIPTVPTCNPNLLVMAVALRATQEW